MDWRCSLTHQPIALFIFFAGQRVIFNFHERFASCHSIFFSVSNLAVFLSSYTKEKITTLIKTQIQKKGSPCLLKVAFVSLNLWEELTKKLLLTIIYF